MKLTVPVDLPIPLGIIPKICNYSQSKVQKFIVSTLFTTVGFAHKTRNCKMVV
jgi:hypothetical protein